MRNKESAARDRPLFVGARINYILNPGYAVQPPSHRAHASRDHRQQEKMHDAKHVFFHTEPHLSGHFAERQSKCTYTVFPVLFGTCLWAQQSKKKRQRGDRTHVGTLLPMRRTYS